MTKNRELTGNILDLVEKLLDEKDITIPSDEREHIGEDAARLCGMEHAKLLDEIEAMLNEEYPDGAEEPEEGCDHSFVDADNNGSYGKEVCRFCGLKLDKE